MLRALKKPLAGALAASLALCALPPAALADAVAFGARPAGALATPLQVPTGARLSALEAQLPALALIPADLRSDFQAVSAETSDAGQARASLERLFEGAPGERDALEAAAAGDYTVVTLHKNVAGADRRLVLLGETHVKSVEDAELGRSVLKHFPVRGLEGFDPSLTIGGRATVRLILPIARALDKALALGRPRMGSSIDAAQRQAWDDEHRRRVVDVVKEMSPEQRARVMENLALMSRDRKMQVEIEDRLVPAQDLMRILESLDAGLEPVWAAGPKLKAFALEKGHKPDAAEQLESIASSIVVLGWGILASLTVLPDFPGEQLVKGLASSGVALTFYLAVGGLLGERFEQRRWFQRVFGMSMGSVTARNKTMAANIVKSLEENRDIDKMLAIVGKAHVPGMKRLLTDAHGFVEIPAK